MQDTLENAQDQVEIPAEITENEYNETSVSDDWDVIQTSGKALPEPTRKPSSEEVFTLSPGMMSHMMIAVVALVIGVLIGAVAFGGQEDAVTEAELRIALREIMASSDVSTNAPVDYMVDNDPFLGAEDAPIVIVEFSDFLCSYCGRHFRETLEPLLERYDGYVRYVYRDFPGVGGQYAYITAMAAECANDQGQFWAYHNLLFNNQQALSSETVRDVLIDYATDLQLDVDIFTTCFDNQEHLTDVQLDRADGQSIGATGTPAFLINGRYISGAQPFDFFVAYIDRELEEMGITPPAG